MPQEATKAHLALALNTTLEREFVSPLTSLRGALEIMRDFPDLSDEERSRFIKNALQDCARLELGVEHLTETVYAAVNSQNQGQSQEKLADTDSAYADRIQFFEELQVVEIDFSDFVFTSSKIVNDFYDLLDQLIESSGQRWYVVVNYHQCRIWPEAWVAFQILPVLEPSELTLTKVATGNWNTGLVSPLSNSAVTNPSAAKVTPEKVPNCEPFWVMKTGVNEPPN